MLPSGNLQDACCDILTQQRDREPVSNGIEPRWELDSEFGHDGNPSRPTLLYQQAWLDDGLIRRLAPHVGIDHLGRSGRPRVASAVDCSHDVANRVDTGTAINERPSLRCGISATQVGLDTVDVSIYVDTKNVSKLWDNDDGYAVGRMLYRSADRSVLTTVTNTVPAPVRL